MSDDPTRIKAELRRMARDLLQQDNACTKDPVFVVREEVRTYGFDPAFGSGSSVWLNAETEASAEEAAELDRKLSELEDTGDWVRTGYQDRPEVVQTFLTRSAAEDYVARSHHRHCGKLHVYVDSANRNVELRVLRWMLADLAARDAVEAAVRDGGALCGPPEGRHVRVERIPGGGFVVESYRELSPEEVTRQRPRPAVGVPEVPRASAWCGRVTLYGQDQAVAWVRGWVFTS